MFPSRGEGADRERLETRERETTPTKGMDPGPRQEEGRRGTARKQEGRLTNGRGFLCEMAGGGFLQRLGTRYRVCGGSKAPWGLPLDHSPPQPEGGDETCPVGLFPSCGGAAEGGWTWRSKDRESPPRFLQEHV